jgi:hypothetical protein
MLVHNLWPSPNQSTTVSHRGTHRGTHSSGSRQQGHANRMSPCYCPAAAALPQLHAACVMQRDATRHARPAPHSKAAAGAAVHVTARGAMHSCHGMQVSVELCHIRHFQRQHPQWPEPCRARLVAGGSLVAAVACVCAALAVGAAALDLQPDSSTGAGHSLCCFCCCSCCAPTADGTSDISCCRQLPSSRSGGKVL